MNREIEQYLIERASAGDAEAFGEIYFRLKDSIYSFAYRMTNQVQIAEEIAQEVFVFFIEHPEKYKADKGTLFAFLCGITRNKVFNHLKKSGNRLETNNFETEHLENLANTDKNTPFGQLLDKEFSEKVEECMMNLSPFQKEVLLLREVEGSSYKEIAEITETNIGVVKGRLYRARRTLASQLAPYLKTQEVTYEVHRS